MSQKKYLFAIGVLLASLLAAFVFYTPYPFTQVRDIERGVTSIRKLTRDIGRDLDIRDELRPARLEAIPEKGQGLLKVYQRLSGQLDEIGLRRSDLRQRFVLLYLAIQQANGFLDRISDEDFPLSQTKEILKNIEDLATEIQLGATLRARERLELERALQKALAGLAGVLMILCVILFRRLRKVTDETRDVYQKIEQRVQERTHEIFKSNEELRKEGALLEERQARFHTMANKGPMLIWISDVRQQWTYFNTTWLSFRGRTLDQETGRGWIEGIHPEDYRGAQDILQRAYEHREPFQTEFRLKNKLGVYRWMLTLGVPRFTDDGEFLGFLGSCLDLTERKEYEAGLRESELRYKNFLDCVPDEIFRVSRDGEILDFQCRKEERGAANEKKFVGHRIQDIYPRETADKFFYYSEKSFSIQKPQTFTYSSTAGNEKRDFEVRLDTKFEEEFRCVVRDVTETRREHEVINRQRDEALQAVKMKSSFVANMSHEIRTPMNAILGFSELLTGTPLNDEQSEHVHTIISSGEMLLKIINDILDYSKLEAGRVDLEAIDFDLNYLIADVFKMSKFKIEQKKIRTLIDMAPDVPRRIKGDPTRLRQVLVNLLSNAVKFTSIGAIGIVVRLESEDLDKNTIRLQFSVNDTGPGIPADKQDKLFESFIQTDASITRKYGGTGLGLAICKALVEAMDGEIWVESQENKGSQFKFRAVFAHAEPEANDITPLPLGKLKDKSVMILDQQEEDRKKIASFCEELEIKVLVRVGTTRGIMQNLDSAYRNNSLPDLIITDITVPDAPVEEMIGRLRKDTRFANMRYLAVVTDPEIGSAKEAHLKGFDGFLPKPTSKEDLAKVIASVLGDARREKTIVTRHMAEEVSCRGLHVLVVEDSVPNQQLMKAYLGALGCEISLAGDGKEAVECLRNGNGNGNGNGFDLCLMDVQMPNMNGLEAARVIRREISRNLPIVALTASAMKEDREKCLEAGMTDYISKPVSLEQLKEKLVKYSGRR